MKDKINIIQFMPYFPPHKWWVEIVWEEIGDFWCRNNFWNFINVTFDVWQKDSNYYNKKWYKLYLIPSFDLISNFPVPKIWKKEFWQVFKILKNTISWEKNNYRVVTHTRFFLSSFIWWVFARKNKIKWIHIEHWSDYVKLSSKIKSGLSVIYDKIFGKWIFKKSDKLLAISKACKKFINKEFVDREVSIFYRGLKIDDIKVDKKWKIKLVYIWRLVNLKWVSDLIESYKESWVKNKLIIIWDGDERQKLEKLSKWFNVEFLWYKDREFIKNYLSNNHIILINPSYQEWMPTTVIEWLASWCVVLATDVWGTREISEKEDLLLFESWDLIELKEKLIFIISNYDNLNWLSLELINDKFNREGSILKFKELVR